MDYWNPDFLFDIANGIGNPLKIDKKTFEKGARVICKNSYGCGLAKELPNKF